MILRLAMFVLLSLYQCWALDVREFGAVGDGIADDTQAIQNAVDACPYLGAVTFPDGNFSIRGIVLKGDCIYLGTGQTRLTLSAANTFLLDVSERSGIYITGLVLDGNGLGGGVIAQGYAPARMILIHNCEFRNVPPTAQFPANLSIVSTWGIIDSTLLGNRFENVAGGIWLTTVQNLSVTNNSFINVSQNDPIYIAPSPAPFPNGDNLQIVGNSGWNIGRIAIEIFRPDPTNGSVLTAPLIANNSFSHWTGVGGMGISITHGDGAIIQGNSIENSTGPTQDTGLEVIIANAHVRDNNINGGFSQGIAVVGTAAPSITGNVISNVTDTGIILGCDNGRDRCASRNSVISGNIITNARLIGIKLDNDWSGGLVSQNTVTRTAGLWAGDNRVNFSGIHQSPAPGPGIIDSNTIVQDSAIWPLGFWFSGIRLNSPMAGSSVTNNVIRSAALLPLGSGMIDNTGSASVGWIISGNSYINIAAEMD
jgi:parallel beta-helix repeat protein